MESKSNNEIFVQQLNRKQNESRIFNCSSSTGDCKEIFLEKESAWIDAEAPWEINSYSLDFRHTMKWLKGGKEFLWFSEKSGWRQLYRVNMDGSKETVIGNNNFDVIEMRFFDEGSNQVYFLASPDNATQRYLYRMKANGKSKAERVSPAGMDGRHDYNISPNGKFAIHSVNNSNTPPSSEIVSLPDHKPLTAESIQLKMQQISNPKTVEFFKIKTEEGVEMDVWMVKPKNFDASKKYPVVFTVYTEPASQTVTDSYGVGRNGLYDGDMREDGYLQISVDGRGTPAPKGREWRKSIYRKIGLLNISDQAMAAKEILKWPFVDPDRIAVWGWSGGGSTTLNLLFQYPDIYKTGIAIAAVTYQPNYDNIYQERYMGIPQENLEDFIKGSPITYAKNLKGNLLYIHGTGDDNVHYNNAEMLVNELIKHNKQFQFMPYPNRTHGISEGEGTREHLSTLYTEYLKKNCPPGPR
jgi:dipeptidyl-peptidase-4